MSYEDLAVEKCMMSLRKEMRYIKYKNKNDEYRINRNKMESFRLILFKFYHDAFKQGVYLGKTK